MFKYTAGVLGLLLGLASARAGDNATTAPATRPTSAPFSALVPDDSLPYIPPGYRAIRVDMDAATYRSMKGSLFPGAEVSLSGLFKLNGQPAKEYLIAQRLGVLVIETKIDQTETVIASSLYVAVPENTAKEFASVLSQAEGQLTVGPGSPSDMPVLALGEINPALGELAGSPAARPVTQPAATSSRRIPGLSVHYYDAHSRAAAWALAISTDGRTLASGGDDGRVIFWSLPEMKLLKSVEVGGLARCLAFNSDGTLLYAPGGTPDITEINTRDYSQRPLALGVMGSVLLVAPFDKDRKLVTVTASMDVLIHSIDRSSAQTSLQPLETRKIFGGFIRHAVISPNRRFLAVSSQNRIGNRSGEPCKLTVFDLEGQAEASYTFDSSGEYNGSSFAFSPDSLLLLLYVPQKPLRAFEFNLKLGQWDMSTLKMSSPRSFSSATCVDSDGVIYVASENRIGAFDRGGQTFVVLVRLLIGPSGGYPSDGIEGLIWGRPFRLIAALQDGRLAVIGAGNPEVPLTSQPSTTIPGREQ